MTTLALVCTAEAYPYLVAYLTDEGVAREHAERHRTEYGPVHGAGLVVVAERDPAWPVLHALVPTPGAVAVTCRGPVGAPDGDDWRARAVDLNRQLRQRLNGGPHP